MNRWSRRRWLGSVTAGLAVLKSRGSADEVRTASPIEAKRRGDLLDLHDYEPRSRLHVKETRVERARFPAIDVHVHVSWNETYVDGVARSEGQRYLAPPSELLAVMDRTNVRCLVNLTGGTGAGLQESLRRYDRAYAGRFLTFTEPLWTRFGETGYAQAQGEALEQAARAGARGVKVLKTLGLFLREGGALVRVDDRRLDPLWDACGTLGLPVAIHTSDPEAFFLPSDRFNERFEELDHHPDWSFHGRDYPSHRELLEARDRVFTRHPKTQFVALHMGSSAEDLGALSVVLDRHRNVWVETGARLGELGRQPRTARRFFDKYQDRILFGTDAVPHGHETPQQVFGEPLYEIYFRFLETEDEYFDYAPSPIPPQGRWRIYGIGLPEDVLRKVYRGNAARLLRLES
jgi:predicted TIM-barrel fold metal-dependent hydrolase